MSLKSVLKEDNWLTSIHITILTNRDPNPRPLLYTLYVVPYYGSLLSVYIGIEKWVINWVMGYKLGNGGTHNPRPLLYTLYMIPLLYTHQPRPQPETLPIYPVASPHQGFTIRVSISIEKSVINSVIGYILRNRYSLHTRPPHETLTIYPQHGSLLWVLVKCVYRY